MNTRFPVTQDAMKETIEQVVNSIGTRLDEKGNLSFIGPHEALGILTEEYEEVIDAVRNDAEDELCAELEDVITAAFWYLATVRQRKLNEQNLQSELAALQSDMVDDE